MEFPSFRVLVMRIVCVGGCLWLVQDSPKKIINNDRKTCRTSILPVALQKQHVFSPPRVHTVYNYSLKATLEVVRKPVQQFACHSVRLFIYKQILRFTDTKALTKSKYTLSVWMFFSKFQSIWKTDKSWVTPDWFPITPCGSSEIVILLHDSTGWCSQSALDRSEIDCSTKILKILSRKQR